MNNINRTGKNGFVNYILDLASIDTETFDNFAKFSYFILAGQGLFAAIASFGDYEPSVPLVVFDFVISTIFLFCSYKKFNSFQVGSDSYLKSHIMMIRNGSGLNILSFAIALLVGISFDTDIHPDLMKILDYAFGLFGISMMVISFYGLKSIRNSDPFTV